MALADTNLAEEKTAKEYGIEFTKDYHELLPKVDVVSIIVLTDLHSYIFFEDPEYFHWYGFSYS